MKHWKDKNDKVFAFETADEAKKFYKGNFADLVEIDETERDKIINPPLTAEQKLQKKIEMATDVVNGTIQKVIDDYNAAHGMKFTNIDSIDKYTKNPDYPHYQFCADVVDWVVGVPGGAPSIWAAARTIQEEVIAGTRAMPTEQEFINLLPAYSGVV